jgi:hypothetical protein
VIKAFLSNLIASVELSFVFAVWTTKTAILETFAVASGEFHGRILAPWET